MAKRPIVTCLDGVPDEFVSTTADIAAITGDSTAKVGDMLATGQIPGMFRFGHRMKIYAGDLRTYFQSCKVGLHRLEGWPPELIELESRRRRKRA
jgi:hypothetical protein